MFYFSYTTPMQKVSACIIVLFCAPVPFAVTMCELPELPRDDEAEARYVQEMGSKAGEVPESSSDAERLRKELAQVSMDRDSKAAELAMLQQQAGTTESELRVLKDALKAKDRQIADLEEEVATLKKCATVATTV